jgi:hypothetical protein
MNSGTTDQVRVKVHQMATRSVWVERTVIVEVPSDLIGDQTRIEEVVRAGERDYGPFYWDPVEGTECLELMDTAVGNQTIEVPDLSADPVSPLGHAEMRGESA